MKLSPTQKRILERMPDGEWRSSFRLRASLSTLSALERRGLVESRHDLGSSFMPQTAIKWRKTNYLAFLRVRRTDKTRGLVKSIGLSSLSENHVEKARMGLLRNMDTDNFFVDDSEVDAERNRLGK